MSRFNRMVLLIVAITIGGCAAVIVDRGYSFRSEDLDRRYQRISCAELKYYFSDPVENPFQFKIEDLGIYVKVIDQMETHWLSVGPGILLPLPVIPWPFGIMAALFSSYNHSKSLTLIINFEVTHLGYQFDPELVSLQRDGTFLKPLSIKPPDRREIWPFQPNEHIIEFLLSESTGPMQLVIDGISRQGVALPLHKIILDNKSTLGLYWLAGINC